MKRKILLGITFILLIIIFYDLLNFLCRRDALVKDFNFELKTNSTLYNEDYFNKSIKNISNELLYLELYKHNKINKIILYPNDCYTVKKSERITYKVYNYNYKLIITY